MFLLIADYVRKKHNWDLSKGVKAELCTHTRSANTKVAMDNYK